jgi:hypothetical protein
MPDELNNYDPDTAVLVAVVKAPRDLVLAREQGWYRIPVASAPYPLRAELLAFYQTAAFGPERWSVRYVAPVARYRISTRRELLPAEAGHPRADERYYRLELGPLHALVRPVPSQRLRRVTFIATTLGRLLHADDLRELWHPSRSGDELAEVWASGVGHTRRK